MDEAASRSHAHLPPLRKWLFQLGLQSVVDCHLVTGKELPLGYQVPCVSHELITAGGHCRVVVIFSQLSDDPASVCLSDLCRTQVSTGRKALLNENACAVDGRLPKCQSTGQHNCLSDDPPKSVFSDPHFRSGPSSSTTQCYTNTYSLGAALFCVVGCYEHQCEQDKDDHHDCYNWVTLHHSFSSSAISDPGSSSARLRGGVSTGDFFPTSRTP